MAAEVGIVVSAGWASWCAPPVWLSFQLPFFQAFFYFRGIDWSCGQHLPHESDSIIFAGLAGVRVIGLSLFHGLCWACPFGCVLWSCYCLAPSWVEWKVGLCKDQILLADPCLAKVPRGAHTDFANWCLFDCFVASSAVASSTFFVPRAFCDLHRTLHISLPLRTALTGFLVVLCQGEMPIGLGGDLR